MKRSIAVILLVAFLISFGAGYLISIKSARAAPPCPTSCTEVRCPHMLNCVCSGPHNCCSCVRLEPL